MVELSKPDSTSNAQQYNVDKHTVYLLFTSIEKHARYILTSPTRGGVTLKVHVSKSTKISEPAKETITVSSCVVIHVKVEEVSKT